ncbi:MAG: 3-oxoacyl-[acyl-carrier-protein] synthase III C-terminal domain-containing protein [Desulfobacterales bacterium]
MKRMVEALSTANPPLYATQNEVFAFYDEHLQMSENERELYRRVLLEGPIRGRYFAFDRREEALVYDPDRMTERHCRIGTRLAVEAARKAMEEACCGPEEIGGIIVNTCTGYLCPGLSSYVHEALGLGPMVKTLDIQGMGCGGAVPNLECAAGWAMGRPEKPVLSIAVEICSATMFFGDDPGLVISNAIFGDGASAAIVRAVGNKDAEGLLYLMDFEAVCYPGQRKHLRYRTEQGRLRNVLGRRVPVLGANAVSAVVENILKRNGLTFEHINRWIVHPGGTSVLRKIEERLGLTEEELRFSYEIFRDYGNMSSPTVMYVLKRMLERDSPESGQMGLILSFGAGFTAFGALVVF